MYTGLLHLHSLTRWLVLVFIVIAVVVAFKRWRSSKIYISTMPASFKISLIVMHIQVVIGLILFFLSPKVIFDPASMGNTLSRFYLVEHSLIMILAAVLLTIGYVKFKKSEKTKTDYKKFFIFSLITLILILAMIPWPFRGFGTGWI